MAWMSKVYAPKLLNSLHSYKYIFYYNTIKIKL